MRFRIVMTLWRKELLDTRRDRRTLFMMIVLPVLLYPATLLIGAQAVILRQESVKAATSIVQIVTEDPNDAPILQKWLQEDPQIECVSFENPEAALAAGKLDCILVARMSMMHSLEANDTLPIDLLYDITEFRSTKAIERIEDILQDIYDQEQIKRLNDIAVRPEYIKPMQIKRVDMATQSKTAGSLLGLILPSLLIVVMALGAFYPAVDLTAGEKERGTFETLLSTPISRMEIVAGKFLTVFVLALLTALLNLASMGATMAVFFTQLTDKMDEGFSIMLQNPLQILAIMLLNLAPLALLISSLMMSVAVFARSFKEAQNYLTPVMMLILLPSMIAGAPGIEMSRALQYIPIVNTVLLFKAAMTGKATLEAVFAVFVSTSVCALFALSFAAWLFQREEVVLAEEPGMPISLRRSDYRPRPEPTISFALTVFGLVMVLIFYLGSLAQQHAPLPGLLFTEWGLILLPTVGMLWFSRTNLTHTLRLRGCPPLTFVGAIIMALSALTLVMGFNAVHDQFLPIPDSYKEEFSVFFTQAQSPSGVLFLLFTMALSPAICEEVLFRGMLLTAFQRRMRPLTAMVIVAVLFGAFHLSIYRFAPTALLGLPLAYIALRTRSLLPGMVMHGVNNSIAILLGLGMVPSFLSHYLMPQEWETTGPSFFVILCAATGLVLGLCIVEWSLRRRTGAPSAPPFRK